MISSAVAWRPFDWRTLTSCYPCVCFLTQCQWMKSHDVNVSYRAHYTASVSPSSCDGNSIQLLCQSSWISRISSQGNLKVLSMFFPDGVPAVSAKHDVHVPSAAHTNKYKMLSYTCKYSCRPGLSRTLSHGYMLTHPSTGIRSLNRPNLWVSEWLVSL